jgi:hypothetical protein
MFSRRGAGIAEQQLNAKCKILNAKCKTSDVADSAALCTFIEDLALRILHHAFFTQRPLRLCARMGLRF